MKKIIFLTTMMAAGNINAMNLKGVDLMDLNGVVFNDMSNQPYSLQPYPLQQLQTYNTEEEDKTLLRIYYPNANMDVFYSPYDQQTTAFITFQQASGCGKFQKGQRVIEIINPNLNNPRNYWVLRLSAYNSLHTGYDECTFKELININEKKCKSLGHRHSKIIT